MAHGRRGSFGHFIVAHFVVKDMKRAVAAAVSATCSAVLLSIGSRHTQHVSPCVSPWKQW